MSSEQRILLTGATGFVGASVLRALLADQAADVPPCVAVLLRPSSNCWRIADLLPRVQRIDGDLTDLAPAAPAIASFAPDTLIHLAWSGVTNTHRDDLAQLDNVAATVALLRVAREIRVQHFVGLGSQAEYGPQHGALREDAPTRPTTLYGAAKLATATLAERLCAMSGIRFAWLRLFSAYGPRDDPSWFIPYLVRQLVSGTRPALTAGEQRWDFLYVADAADAIVRLARNQAAQGIFNLGSGHTTTIRALAERIRDLVAPGAALGFGEVPYRTDQVMHLEADITRLRAATGWSPRVDLDEGLRHTIDWFRAR